jgi:signal transduction histidine kinase
MTPGQRYDEADVKMAEDLARNAAQAVDNAGLYSEAEESRAQAESANRTKDVFLAVLSHELRTPMNAVYGWARMLQMGQIDEATTPRAFEAIVRNSHVQLQLIDDLLDMSRIMSARCGSTSAGGSTARAGGRARRRPTRRRGQGTPVAAAHRPQCWTAQRRSGPGPADCLEPPDERHKFTPKGGRIQVTLQRVNSHLEIVVSDSGVGINRELLPFIFDRFRQGDSGSTRAQGGLGIGLALVRHLTELHGAP